MNTQIIAIANQKGGVGKTTTCANLGIGLAQSGKKVLLIDGDPQGSLTISLGNPQPDKLPFTLSDAMGRILMDEPIRPGEGILHHPEGIDLMPADIQLSGMEVSLVNAMSRETILRQYLDTLKGQYSHILIDCQPSLGMLTVNALAAANRVIIPVQAEYLPANVTDKGNQNREIREQNRLLKEVKRRIAALTAWIKEKTAQTKENPFLSVPILSERSEQPSTLLELLNRAYTEAAKPQSRYEKIQDLKLYAKAFNFLQSRNITTLVQLQEVVSDMKKQYWTTNGEIKQTEKLLHERKELIDQAEKYREHRPTYKAYMQTKPKKQEDFFESNRVALTLYQSAERYLKEHLGEDKVLKPKAWKAEVADLTQKKSRLYGSLQTLKAEVQEAEAVKKCVEQAVQPEQGKEKTQNKRRDMEL